jgi:hypothetical protein
MALGDPYITKDQFKAYVDIPLADTDDDLLIDSARLSATEWVNDHCQRQFNKTTVASARQFTAATNTRVHVDDFHTITDLVVKTDDGDTGTYSQTWDATDYVLEPYDGVVGSTTGYPFRTVVAVAGRTFPRSARPRVQITAQWGWNAIPESVTLATKIVAAYVFNLKDSPLGVVSFGESGLIRDRGVALQAEMLLRNYRQPARTGTNLA